MGTPTTWSPLLPGTPVPGNHSYWVHPPPTVPTLTGYQPLILGPPTQLPILPGIGYDLVVHRYTYLDWVYQVLVNHIGNGAGLWSRPSRNHRDQYYFENILGKT